MYYYRIPSYKEQQPEWFRSRLMNLGDEYDRMWVWKWNDRYDKKIIIRDGAAHIIFESEQDLMMFMLREV